MVGEREGHVLVDGHGVEQRAFLEEHARHAPDGEEVLALGADDLGPVDRDAALLRPQEPRDALQEHGLPDPAAGR